MDRKNFFYKLIYERNTFGTTSESLYQSAKNNKYLLQRLCLDKKLNVHSGCVNSICWDSTGQYLLSGSDDLHLCITNAFTCEIKARIRTGHQTNIFSAKYLPNTGDSQVVSCSGDGIIIFSDLNRPETSFKNIFECQAESVYDIATVPNDSHTFLSCSHDHTVRWYDLRVKQSCVRHPSYSNGHISGRLHHKCTDDVLIRCDYPITAITVNQLLPWQLAIGCSDSIIRIYDRRMLSTKALGGYSSNHETSVLAKFTYNGLKNQNRITSLSYSRNCQQILASYSNDYLYLFNMNDVKNTIAKGSESDIISEKSDNKATSSFKRFRFRGDWSDTGPYALPTEELRAANQTPSTALNINSSGTTSNNESNISANSDPRNNSPRYARLRNLNTILNLIIRRSNANRSSDNNAASNDPSSSFRLSANSLSDQILRSNSSSNSQRSQRQEQDQSSNSGQTSRTNTGDNPDNSQGFFIQIFDNDLDFSAYYQRQAHTDNEDEDNEEDDRVFVDEEEDIDSDNTIDSAFNIGSSHASNSGRQRSRSSSSNDSRNHSRRRRTRSIRNYRQRRLYKSLKNLEENNKEREKRLRTYKISNFKTFVGHRNSRTVIKEATFWGDDYIVSGSDCGHIFFWSIETGELVMILEGDHHVVNCIQPHPTNPILASSGIDYDIKLWSHRCEDNNFNEAWAKKIMERNQLMLEESRDTVTVPVRYVLNLFSNLRNRHQGRNQSANENLEDEDMDQAI